MKSGDMMKKNKGFTLVELIVVISILAVLALILVPSVLGYVVHAQKVVDENNVKQLNTMTTMTSVKLDQEIPVMFKDTLSDIQRYRIISENESAALPNCARKNYVFKWKEDINQWISTPNTAKSSDFTIKDGWITGVLLGPMEKDIIFNGTDFKEMIKGFKLNENQKYELNNLIITNLSSNYTKDNPFIISPTSFKGSTSIDNVELPNYVKVEGWAFENTPIKTVSLGENAQLDKGSFYNSKCESIAIGNNSTISNYAISNNNNELTSLTIGENCSIGAGAVSGNFNKLTTITIGDGYQIPNGECGFNISVDGRKTDFDTALGNNGSGTYEYKEGQWKKK